MLHVICVEIREQLGGISFRCLHWESHLGCMTGRGHIREKILLEPAWCSQELRFLDVPVDPDLPVWHALLSHWAMSHEPPGTRDYAMVGPESCPGHSSFVRQFTYCVQTGRRSPSKVAFWICSFPILRFLFNPTVFRCLCENFKKLCPFSCSILVYIR